MRPRGAERSVEEPETIIQTGFVERKNDVNRFEPEHLDRPKRSKAKPRRFNLELLTRVPAPVFTSALVEIRADSTARDSARDSAAVAGRIGGMRECREERSMRSIVDRAEEISQRNSIRDDRIPAAADRASATSERVTSLIDEIVCSRLTRRAEFPFRLLAFAYRYVCAAFDNYS